MSYLELLKLAAPEAIVVVTALAVLTIALATRRALVLGPIVAVLGVAVAIVAVVMLPSHANLFGGMLVISPLNSLFKIICLALALATVPLVSSEKALPNPGEYIAVLLLGSVGLMLLIGSEELLMIFIGLELLGVSLYVLAAFDKADVHSAEAGLKYFLFGSTASAFTLFWISLIYGLYGTTALAAILILLGNFVALAQTNVRRLRAYSAVAHGGYTLLGVVAGGREGFSATLFYTTTYAVTLIGAFAVVGAVRRETGGDDLQNFSRLAARSPFLAACMAIFFLSLAGLPPLAGFFGKFYLFSVAFHAGGNHGLLWLVAIALFGSFVSLYYYLIVLKVIFVDQKPESATAGDGPDFFSRITVTLLATVVLVLAIMPQTLAAKIIASLP